MPSVLYIISVSDAIEFQRVCQQWSTSCWTVLQQFEVDVSICQVRLATLMLLMLSLVSYLLIIMH